MTGEKEDIKNKKPFFHLRDLYLLHTVIMK